MCGFIGIIGTDPVAPALYLALQALQHRGQDAAGIGTRHDGRFHLHKDLGLISQAIPPEILPRLPGRAGIAHVRYPTAGVGIGDREDAQPFVTRSPGIVLAHNGNVTNMRELESTLRASGHHVLSGCDAEPILLVLAHELTAMRPAGHTLEDVHIAVGRLMKCVKGSYSVAAVLEIDGQETLLCFRDPHGIRPGVYGRNAAGAWMVASESVALDVLDYTIVDHIPPGAMVLLRRGDAPIVRAVDPKPPRPCMFERIYFARPDSILEDGRVAATRWALGERLAERVVARGIEADVVVAVPDTSRDAAQAMAERLGKPNREGFIKNRYSGRTFIMPNQATREAALRLKLNPIREVFAGKRVILVDDSIVRGSTVRRLLEMVRALGPTEIHVAIFSPPVRHPCFYGIDMPSHEELVASSYAPDVLEEALARALGIASLTFLPLEALTAHAGPGACTACFSGEYVIPVTDDERAYILANRNTGPPSHKAAPAPVQ